MVEPVCVDDFEEQARKILPKYAYDFYASGANDEVTLKENRTAFKRLWIKPHVLHGISSVDMSISLFGEPISMPICMAPVGVQGMADEMGEVASARAAQATDTCFILSCMSSATIEDVARATPNALRWLQVYIYRDLDFVKSLVRRAEENGYKAIVLTVDAIAHGKRLNDLKNQSALVPHLRFGNIGGGPATETGATEYATFVKSLIEQSASWDTVKWLKSITRLPLLLKGILTAEDARLAVDQGIDGIIVSNHGGRQLDGVPASIDALPEIIQAVQEEVDVYMDGGIRQGSDVLKALALGARAVFIGRPCLWGLACQGEKGVAKVLEMLREELKIAMTLAGCQRLCDIKPSLVVNGSSFSRL